MRVLDRGLLSEFRHGDVVYVDPDEPAEPGRQVALRGEVGLTLWRLVDEDGMPVLRSPDPHRPDEPLDAESVAAICGVFVGGRFETSRAAANAPGAPIHGTVRRGADASGRRPHRSARHRPNGRKSDTC